MRYLAYARSDTMPQRMARKRARRDVFAANKRAKRLQRKAERLKRKSQEEE